MLASSSRNTLRRTSSQLTNRLSSSGVAASIPDSFFFRQRRNASLLTKSAATERTSPRHELWSYTQDLDFQGANVSRSGVLGRYNVAIADLAAQGDLIGAIRLCAKMKSEAIRPDLTTYNLLIKACRRNFYLEAWAIYEDMLALGIFPDRETFHRLLQANVSQPFTVSRRIWDKMLASNIEPNVISYEFLINQLLAGNNLEMALVVLAEMDKNDITPSVETAERVIMYAARLGNAKLALNLATSYESGSVRPLPIQAWVHCLISCATMLYAEGVKFCWKKVVHEHQVNPDEGLCIEVLHTAGRHALPDLAAEVIEVLTKLRVELQEYHFSPLIQAFCASGSIKEAFSVLTVMNNLSEPIPETIGPILRALEKDPDLLETACTAVEQLRAEGHTVHKSALHCIISASISLGDLQRAVGIFSSLSTFNIRPDIDTFNMMLNGCVAMTNRELGDRLLLEMKEAAVPPNSQTYQSLISLCLTQMTYEDAFFYLEEMKSLNMVPPSSVYEALIRKCVSAGDSRYTLAVEEMKECGYELSAQLLTYINTGEEPSEDGGKKIHRRTLPS